MAFSKNSEMPTNPHQTYNGVQPTRSMKLFFSFALSQSKALFLWNNPFAERLPALLKSPSLALLTRFPFIVQVRDLSHAVNATKHMIDGARTALERKRNERLEQGGFDFLLSSLRVSSRALVWRVLWKVWNNGIVSWSPKQNPARVCTPCLFFWTSVDHSVKSVNDSPWTGKVCAAHNQGHVRSTQTIRLLPAVRSKLIPFVRMAPLETIQENKSFLLFGNYFKK